MKLFFVLCGVALIIVLAWNIIGDVAPSGYEDEAGFHYGEHPEDE